MSIAILLQQILIIFLEIGTGAAVTKLGIMDDRNSKFLSNLVMSVTLPCTLLASASIDGGREAVAGMLKRADGKRRHRLRAHLGHRHRQDRYR